MNNRKITLKDIFSTNKRKRPRKRVAVVKNKKNISNYGRASIKSVRRLRDDEYISYRPKKRRVEKGVHNVSVNRQRPHNVRYVKKKKTNITFSDIIRALIFRFKRYIRSKLIPYKEKNPRDVDIRRVKRIRTYSPYDDGREILNSRYPYTRSEINRRRIARRKRRIRQRIRRVSIICISFVFVFLVLYIINFKPFSTTVVAGVKLRGVITKETNVVSDINEYIQTDKEYTINVENALKDSFGNEVVEVVDPKLVKISLKDDTFKDSVQINSNKIKVDNSVTSGNTIGLVISYNNINNSYSYIVKDNINEEIDENMIITNPNEYDAVVNKQRHLSSSYKPADLVKPNIDFMQSNESVMYLRVDAANALEELIKGAQDAGYKFYGVSGFRSYDLQLEVYKDNINQYGSEEKANFYSAKAGESEHQLGLSIDVSTSEVGYSLVESLGDTKAGKWLADNCYKYGYIIRFPKNKEKITGYSYEPWHIRYVGKPLAKTIYENELTLEEYFESKQ